MAMTERTGWSLGALALLALAACGSQEGQPARSAPEATDERPIKRPAADGAPTIPEDPESAPEGQGPDADLAPTKRPEERAMTPEELHRESIVIDTHNDVTLRLIDQPDFDFSKRDSEGHTDLVRMIEGGLDAQFFAVWVNPRDYSGEEGWERSLDMFSAIHRTAQALNDKVAFVKTAAELRRTVAEGKVAFLIGVEGAHALGNVAAPEKAIKRLKRWYDMGARYLTLTWMNSNALGGSSGDRGKTKGLTELGRRAVREMNDWGMMVDVSHVSDPTFLEAIEVSRSPVLASHSGVRAIHDHYRNVTDEMLKALAKNGGALCVVYYPGYLDGAWAAARRKARRHGGEIEAAPVKLSLVVDHIDHVVEVAGIDHVCLGSDFDGIGHAPVGLEDVSKLPGITAELRRRGYSDDDVRKVLGENVLRVMEANERNAASGGD